MAQGHGHPITGRLRALGSRRRSASISNSAISGDMFTVARMALAIAARARQRGGTRRSGGIPATSTVPAAEALDWITTRGAAMLGMADRIGSLAPGKQADIAVMSLGPLAMWPVHDAVATVVMQGSGAGCATCWSPAASPSATAGCCALDLAAVRAKARRLGRTHPRPS